MSIYFNCGDWGRVRRFYIYALGNYTGDHFLFGLEHLLNLESESGLSPCLIC